MLAKLMDMIIYLAKLFRVAHLELSVPFVKLTTADNEVNLVTPVATVQLPTLE